MSRTSRVERTTKESSVLVELNLDGTGEISVDTGVPFFDHMLTLFARHGLFDLDLDAKVGKLRAGVHEDGRRIVVERLGMEALHEADVVHDGREMRQQLAEPHAGLAVAGELVRRGEQLGLLADLRVGVRQEAREHLHHACVQRTAGGVDGVPGLLADLLGLVNERPVKLEALKHAQAAGRVQP